jgi:hypothetical protein
MTTGGETICARVFDRMIEHGDLGGEAALLDHAGSCMTCFRTLSELRDASRLKEILRAAPPAQPPGGDPFWADLAARVVDATLRPALPAVVPPVAPVARRTRRRITGGIGVAILAAAAAWVVAVRHPVGPSGVTLIPTGPAASMGVTLSAITSPLASDDASEAFDVGELDGAVLQRLADHLRRKPHPATYVASDDADVDEEVPLNDVLAELDGPALLRVERVLSGTSL